MAERWKKLWYRDDPFNAAFHETGSFDLLVLMGITHRMPSPMTVDEAFTKDWVSDCNDRCFMVYDDSGGPEVQQTLRNQLRLRKDLLQHLKREPAATPVIAMIRNLKVTPVN